ncbi:Uncharacterized conserved protein [Phaffia rhodozyma]|uniref:Uncharacterized conserved protein n=1 Tax=Phaffia rhodozyma TaxID=264483 RepID=A0A0F7SGW9_PHARH|nr:Uncharacterized conserved protein [Phaffia rhodozyma]
MLALDATQQATIIGVLFSISGNILISLALNLQKLAHEKISSASSTPLPLPSDLPVGDPCVPTEQTSLLSSTRTGVCSESLVDLNEEEDQEVEEEDNGDDSTFNPWILEGRSTYSEKDGPSYFKSKVWWAGLSLMTLGEFGNFLSYAYAPASVVAPLGTVSLVANWVFAPFILGETFRSSDIQGVFLAIIGASIVVLASRDDQSVLTPDVLIGLLKQPFFVAYSGLMALGVGCLIVFSEMGRDDRFLLIDVGLCALLGGFTVLSTKAVSSLLSTLWLDVFSKWIFYPILAVLIVTCIGQLRYLNKALQRFDSKVVVPTQFCLFSTSAIVGSSILFRDFDDVSLSRSIIFILGLLITFLGVYLLTPSSYSPPSFPSSAPHPPLSLPSSPSPSYHPSLFPHSRPSSPSPSILSSHVRSHTPTFGHNQTVGPAAITLTRPSSRGRKTSTATLRGLSAGHYLLVSSSPGRVIGESFIKDNSVAPVSAGAGGFGGNGGGGSASIHQQHYHQQLQHQQQQQLLQADARRSERARSSTSPGWREENVRHGGGREGNGKTGRGRASTAQDERS